VKCDIQESSLPRARGVIGPARTRVVAQQPDPPDVALAEGGVLLPLRRAGLVVDAPLGVATAQIEPWVKAAKFVTSFIHLYIGFRQG
jgi:hypothetical protein